MIESSLFWVKNSTNITLHIELIKNLLVTGSNNDARGKLLSIKEERCGHDFVAMEAVAVGAHELDLGAQFLVVQVFFDELFLVFGSNNLQIFSDFGGVIV